MAGGDKLETSVSIVLPAALSGLAAAVMWRSAGHWRDDGRRHRRGAGPATSQVGETPSTTWRWSIRLRPARP